MHTNNNQKELLVIKGREATGKILYSVISGALTPFEATKYFPKNSDDTSLKIAWNALLHYDADEELRIKDPEYAQEQIKYIEFLASILSKGEALPESFLEDYEKWHDTTIMPKQDNWLGKLKSFFRFT